jgi:hypothetical protein
MLGFSLRLMEEVCSPETSLDFYRISPLHIPEDIIFHEQTAALFDSAPRGTPCVPVNSQ